MYFQKIAALFSLALLVSCATTEGEKTESPIAGCGAGIERSITAKIEANYAKATTSGKLDAGFVDTIRPIFDANGASAEKQQQYLVCFQEIDSRIRAGQKRTQCLAGCDSDQAQCLSDQKTAYDQCIRKGQASCMLQCATVHQLSKSECTENCRDDKPYNIGAWEKNHACIAVSAANCSPTKSSCRSLCSN